MSHRSSALLVSVVLLALFWAAVYWQAFTQWAQEPARPTAMTVFAAFVCGASVSALVCAIFAWAFVQQAGADWRRRGDR